MLDRNCLSRKQTAIVAVGITADGYKHVLDFELGSAGNADVCQALMRRLVSRGFGCKPQWIAVLDRSLALRPVLLDFFPDTEIQRCLVHKERNIRAKLSKRHWGELARRFSDFVKSGAKTTPKTGRKNGSRLSSQSVSKHSRALRQPVTSGLLCKASMFLIRFTEIY